MLQQGGATLLACELQALTEAVIRKRVQDLDTALECLMQAILLLPGYIEQVISSGIDRPIPLLPLINEMRGLRDADALSNATFFYPEMPVPIQLVAENQINQLNQSGISTLLPKIRQKYQVVLAAYLREQQREKQLQLMMRIFAKLLNLCWGSPLSPLWEAGMALIEGLQSQHTKQTLHISNLLRAVDTQLRVFVEKGAPFINTTPDDHLFRGLLYFIALSDSNTHFNTTLKSRYKLTEALTKSQNDSGIYIVSDATTPVIQALNDELAGVKDAFDLYLLAIEPDPLVLQNQLPVIQQISDTLTILGLEDQRLQVRQYKQQLYTLIETGRHQGQDAEAELMTIASGFLKLETVLNQYAAGQQPTNDTNPLLNEVLESVIQETRNNLDKTKEAIVDYVDHQFNRDYLYNACDLLRHAQGGLAMTPFVKASTLVEQCADFIDNQWNSDPVYHPDKQELEHLADLVTAIEYYLDRLSDQNSDSSDSILKIAEESLSKLRSVTEIPTPVSEVTYDVQPIETSDSSFDLVSSGPNSFELGNLTLMSIENEEPELQPLNKTVFLIDNPAAESTDKKQKRYITSPDEVIQFVLETPSAVSTTYVEPGIPAEPEPLEQSYNHESDSDLIDAELLDVFIEEATEVQQQLSLLIPQWSPTSLAASEQSELLKDIRRAFHTLKGSGRMVEANVVAELGWSVENMLNRYIEGSAPPNKNMHRLVDRVACMLPDLIQDFSDNNQLLTPDVLVCMEMADALATGEQYLAPEHPDELTEEDDSDISVQFGEVISESEHPSGIIQEPIEALIEQPIERVTEEPEEQSLQAIFQTEARSHLNTIQTFIDKVESTGGYLQISDDVQRALHTLKGITRMSEVEPLADLVTALERNVKDFRSHQIPADDLVVRMLQEGSHLIADALNQMADTPSELNLDSDGFLTWLKSLHHQLISRQQASTTSTPESEITNLSLDRGLEHLLQADTYLSNWQDKIAQSELAALHQELTTLTVLCTTKQLHPIGELSNVLLDVCHYLSVHTAKLPESLASPLANGFETLLDMLNQVAAQQTPVPPNSYLQS